MSALAALRPRRVGPMVLDVHDAGDAEAQRQGRRERPSSRKSPGLAALGSVVACRAPSAWPLHRLGRGDAQELEAVAYHGLRREREIEPRIAQAGILDDELVRAVVGVEIIRQVPQIVHQGVRVRVAPRTGARFPETRSRV